MLANCRSPFRPTDLPLTANLWRWSSVKRGRLPSCSWRTRTSSCKYSMTACCRRFIHPAKQTSRNDSGFMERLSLYRSDTTSFALELTTSAPLAIPTILTDAVRSNFRTLRDPRPVPAQFLFNGYFPARTHGSRDITACRESTSRPRTVAFSYPMDFLPPTGYCRVHGQAIADLSLSPPSGPLADAYPKCDQIPVQYA